MENIKFYFEKALDIDKIAEVFKLSFNQDFDVEYWKWRFLNNPNDDKVFISYIEEGDDLAAYYAVSPCELRIKDETHKIALSNMTMTHPDYRGKGYFTMLANALYEQLKINGYLGVYGFANANSHYGFRKHLNWQDLAMLNIFKVKPETFRGSRLNMENIEFSVHDFEPAHLDGIENMSVSDAAVMVNRNRDNYIWRLGDIPTQNYQTLIIKKNNKIAARVFFKFYGEEIDIIEFLYSKENKEDLLLNGIFFLIKEYNMSVNIWSNLHSNEHLILEKHGFEETAFNTYFGIIPLQENSLMSDFKNWHFRFYDSDIF